jgi:3-oxoacyl-[acyl-carrier protein] reductase
MRRIHAQEHSTMPHLTGKVALVTGGSRGIGAAIAKHLAQDGADVALTYVSSPDKASHVVAQIDAAGRRGLAIHADGAHPSAMAAAVEQTAAELGRLDILVNNAGIFIPSPFEDATLDEVERMWAVNVRAVIVAIQAAIRHMDEGGRIINIGSCLAERVPGPGVTLYSMSKAALVGLTKGLARDLGRRGITVNCVEPGPIDTDMNPADGPFAAAQIADLALDRFGTTTEVAAAITYLAGPNAAYVTGTELTIDGGHTA